MNWKSSKRNWQKRSASWPGSWKLWKKREEKLEEEWSGFPKEQDLKIAAREYERREERLKDLTEKIQSQREHTEEERKVLEEIRSRAREICQKCYLAARLEDRAALLVLASAARLDLCEGENLVKLPLPATRAEFFASVETLCRREPLRPCHPPIQRSEEEQQLIRRAKELLMRYEAYKTSCTQMAESLYNTHFSTFRPEKSAYYRR